MGRTRLCESTHGVNAARGQRLGNLGGLGLVLVAWIFFAVYFSPTTGWTFFFQLTVNGLILGSIYALIALGYSMVYGILKLLNFAHGDVYMIGAFIGFGVLTLLGGAAQPGDPGRRCSSSACSRSRCSAPGFLGRRDRALRLPAAARRAADRAADLARSASRSSSRTRALLLFGSQYRNYDGFDLISYNGIHIGGDNGVFIQYLGVLVIVGAVALMIALLALVRWTRLGKAMRAVSFDREAAAMMGIDTDRVIAAHVLHRLRARRRGGRDVRPALQPDLPPDGLPRRASRASPPRSSAASAAFPGAMLGGLLVGLVESWAQGLPERQLSPTWSCSGS